MDRKADGVSYKLERVTRHSTTVLEQLAINLQETPAGTYTIVVEVSDQNSGRKVANSTSVTIR
jgi:hypothetical protein